MALMLAGSVIGSVFNTLAGFTGNVFLFAIIFIIGHALNMGLSLLSWFVHDMRLQCLEFFGKFYKDGGRAFAPLCVRTKFVNIVKG
jgi:V/A-type H+-transporting ATPase subunit I